MLHSVSAFMSSNSSCSDRARVIYTFAKVYNEFTTTENMKSFLLANSDRKFDNGWYKAGELNRISKKVNDFAFEKNASVSEVIESEVAEVEMKIAVILPGSIADESWNHRPDRLRLLSKVLPEYRPDRRETHGFFANILLNSVSDGTYQPLHSLRRL